MNMPTRWQAVYSHRSYLILYLKSPSRLGFTRIFFFPKGKTEYHRYQLSDNQLFGSLFYRIKRLNYKQTILQFFPMTFQFSAPNETTERYIFSHTFIYVLNVYKNDLGQRLQFFIATIQMALSLLQLFATDCILGQILWSFKNLS